MTDIKDILKQEVVAMVAKIYPEYLSELQGLDEKVWNEYLESLTYCFQGGWTAVGWYDKIYYEMTALGVSDYLAHVLAANKGCLTETQAAIVGVTHE
jgi:hypothetical protein